MKWLYSREPRRRGASTGCASILLRALAVATLLGPLGSRAQELEQAQKDFLRGQYEKAAETARKRIQASPYAEGWRVLLVQSLLTLGRYAEANSNAVAAVDELPGNIQLGLLARETALYQNNRDGAARQLEEIKNMIERRGRFAQNGENLVALGRALLLLGVEPRLALENCFRRAYDMYPP
ncbi:MAG: tetratricopeptide repeat protein, partial [Limisphaerales bacterium]